MSRYPIVLSIAGSDSGGCAGIQADIKTISALGCFATTAITAITAQNTQGVQTVQGMDESLVHAQIFSIASDMYVDAVKIGMLHDATLIQTVAETLKTLRLFPIVLDPVMVSSSGDTLLESSAVEALKKNLFPIATIVTPNLDEASFLLQRPITQRSQMKDAAKELLQYGSRYVLLKGGHLKKNTKIQDVLVSQNEVLTIDNVYLNTKNTHGTGCSLSAAIASFLALGSTVPDAVQQATQYLHSAILAGAEVQTGKGNGPVNHFFNPQPLHIIP
jgi:hydroxymethylpyrimidine/phosphomethylpyrimidine kinase